MEGPHPARMLVLAWVEWLWADQGYAPSVREISARVGRNLSTTHAHLEHLREQRLVTWNPGLIRTLRLTPEGTRVLSEYRLRMEGAA